MKVIKRNGQYVDFNEDKIYNAISKANKECKDNNEKVINDNLLGYIVKIISETLHSLNRAVSVEEIQDIVEKNIAELGFYDVSKRYIKYRYKRELARNTTDKDIFEMIKGENEYWNTENSNKNAKTVTTQRDYIAGITSKDITKRFLLPNDIIKADEEGIIHFHDSDYFIQTINNCCLINLEDMLQNGTVINKKMIEKPHKFITAITIATQIITAVASSQYGGTSINLSHLTPFVRDSYNYYYNRYISRGFSKEDSEKYANEDTLKEIKDSVQTFNYQINSMSTTNGQTPFISVFMYLSDNKEYIKETALVIEEFFKQRIQGIKNEKGIYITQEFPKLLYVLEDLNIREDSEYFYLTHLSAICNSKRLSPDYISEKKMIEYKNGDVYGCMGCRSFLTVDRFTKKYGNIAKAKNFKPNEHKYWGRFNQGVVTLSLPDVAFSSGRDKNKFWELMEERTELCHKALKCRHERLEGTLSDVAPILWQHGAFARLDKGETIDELLHHGYSTISLGYAGLYECVKYMTGNSHSDNGIGEEFGLEIMQYLNEKCNKWKEEEDIDYSPYGSPIESATYKFAKCLKKRFGEDIFIKLDGKDRNYITNSYHVNVFEEINPFEKISIENKFQKLSTGGAVSYIEASDLKNNISAELEIIKHIYETILYGEINIKSDNCMKCNYDGEIKIIDENGVLDWECPICKNRDHDTMYVARRTCGYVGSNFWNQGRTNEIKDRYVHLDCHEYKGDDF